MSIKYSVKSKTLSVREARAQFASLINQASELGISSIVTKYNQPIAMIVPLNTGKRLSRTEKKQQVLDAAAGLWSDRKETAQALAQKLRTENERYEKVFD